MPRSHSVAQGETLTAIAVRYTGSAGGASAIVTANPQLNARKQSPEGWPYIYPGDTLIIPENQTAAPAAPAKNTRAAVVGGGDCDCSIVIDGKKFTGFTSYSLKLSYDSMDTFAFNAPYNPSIQALREIAAPFAYKLCEVFYNDELVFRGTLLTPDPTLEDKAGEITLQGAALCEVLNDCTVPPACYPLQCKGLTLKGIADAACEPYNIPCVFADDPGPEFTEVDFKPTDKILDFLCKLAKQRRMLGTNTAKGELQFFRAKREEVFASFTEGKYPLISVKTDFDPQNMYSHITGITNESEYGLPLAWVFENKYLIDKGVIRHHTIDIKDVESISDLEKAVTAYAGRTFADCVKIRLECEGHTNEKNELFKKGMFVSVYAPSAMIARETVFIAREVELMSTTEGKTASLSLVLPGAYTEELEAFPWEA